MSKKETQENPTRPGIRSGRVTPLGTNVRTAPAKHQRGLSNNRKGYGKSPTLQHRRPPRTSLRIQRTQRRLNQTHHQSPSLTSAQPQQEPPSIKGQNISPAPLQSVGSYRHRRPRCRRGLPGVPLKIIPQAEGPPFIAPKEQNDGPSWPRTILRGTPGRPRTD